MVYMVGAQIMGKECLLVNMDQTGHCTFMGSNILEEAIRLIDTRYRDTGNYEQSMSQLIWWMQTKPKVVEFDSFDEVKQLTETKVFCFNSLASHGSAVAILDEYQEYIPMITVYEYSPVKRHIE